MGEGIAAGVDLVDLGRNQRAGYALGVLLETKRITEREHDAGIRAGRIWRRWRCMTGCPSPHAAASGLYGPRHGGARDVTAEAWGAARADYEGLCRLLRGHGDIVQALVESVCADDVMPASLDAWRAGFKRALAALAREWRI